MVGREAIRPSPMLQSVNPPAMSETRPDSFEMRRLESLSNTIFGVAMTLLAYDMPKPNFVGLPTWDDLAHAYSSRLAGLTLSFIIAGLFWISHHRRLARQPYAGRGTVTINLLFLLSIILLPVTNGLYGNYRLSSAVAVLYGAHLTVIASLNALLWWIASQGRLSSELVGAISPVIIFVPGTVFAAFLPDYAAYVWLLAFGGPLVRRFVRADPVLEAPADDRG